VRLAPRGMNRPPLPRAFWWLPLVAIAAWWPIEPWWQSDDFFAVHYVQNGGNVLRDFVGPQYGATDIWAFYRPLITASFWLDQVLGGPFPPLSHISNAVAHGLSTLLLALIWRRFLPAGAAFGAALLWALSPSHTAAITWAVGRVDSHSTVWCFAAIWCVLRTDERVAERGAAAARRSFAPAVMTALALASKEVAIVVPPVATLLLFARTPGEWRARLHHALRRTAGPWLVLLAWLPFRWLVLGQFGGYEAAVFDAVSAAKGFAQELVNFASPLLWIGAPNWLPLSPHVWTLAGGAPLLLALVAGSWRQPRLALAAAAAAALTFVPMVNLLSSADNPQLMRYWYVPSAILCGIVASAGRWFVVAVLLAWAGPLVLMRVERHRADVESRTIHEAVLAKAADAPALPMFVAGLPHVNARGTVVQLQYGIDRMLAPPFTNGPVPLFALRPLAMGPGVFALDDGMPWALPLGSTWLVTDGTLRAARDAPPLPPLPITGDAGGGLDLTTQQLDTLVPEDAVGPQLHTPGVRTPWLRLTVFTACGYLATVFQNHADATAADGLFRVRTWFVAANGLKAGRIAYPGGIFIGDALVVPTVVDIVTEFPVLLEGGDVDLTAPVPKFQPTHRARRLVTFRFDRQYASWVRRVQGR
jgi:hypothetical protein